MSRRCVITGMGVVSPLGSTVDSMWENEKNGVCGIENITKFDTTDFKVKVAGEVKDFDPEKYMTKKDIREMILLPYMRWVLPYRQWMTVVSIWRKRTHRES